MCFFCSKHQKLKQQKHGFQASHHTYQKHIGQSIVIKHRTTHTVRAYVKAIIYSKDASIQHQHDRMYQLQSTLQAYIINTARSILANHYKLVPAIHGFTCTCHTSAQAYSKHISQSLLHNHLSSMRHNHRSRIPPKHSIRHTAKAFNQVYHTSM